MNILISYYSRTGITRKTCELLAKELDEKGISATLEEITEKKDRKGIIGWLCAGKDAFFKKESVISDTSNNPADFDMTILATPVWAFTAVPAILTYVREVKDKIKNVAFIATMDGSGDKGAFADLEKTLGKTPSALMTVFSKDIKKNNMEVLSQNMNDFIKALSI